MMKPLKQQKLPKFIKRILWKSRIIVDPFGLLKIEKDLDQMSCDDLRFPEIWKESFKQLLKSGVGYDQYVKDFYRTRIMQTHSAEITNSDLVLICIVKNDIGRMKKLIEYYRDLGVGHFAILDDHSDDGTREYLNIQDDVDCWSSNCGYTTSMRQAWISRLIDFYGFNKWYLVVDSDEFITYPNCEHISLPSITQAMSESGVKRAHCFLLDMYSRNGLFAPFDPRGFMDEYNYFDRSGYWITDRSKLTNLSGGMRVRLFSFGSFFLSKTPLFYADPGFVPCSSHYSFPFSDSGEELNLGVLRHYKFLPQDKEKYQLRIESANFSGGSSEYIKYMNEYLRIGDSLIEEGVSAEFRDSGSLELLELPEESKIDYAFAEKLNSK